MLDCVGTELGERFCDDRSQVGRTQVLRMEMFKSGVRNVVNVLLGLETSQLNANPSDISRRYTAVVDLCTSVLEEIEQPNGLEVSGYADVLGNQQHEFCPCMQDEQAVDQAPKRPRRPHELTVPIIDDDAVIGHTVSRIETHHSAGELPSVFETPGDLYCHNNACRFSAVNDVGSPANGPHRRVRTASAGQRS